jgi:indolepyruvate ferredoxin oxidoreductase beta subunit
MKNGKLRKDPFNVIITGVGGQGNVLSSRIFANMFVRRGFQVTIGETFGASQRGGSVMSHLRISAISAWSPQIPKGKADVVASLEPIEALRVLAAYGNPDVQVLTNARPIYPVGVIAGVQTYPDMEEIRESLEDLSGKVWIIDATDEAIKLGHPILGNVIMIGALCKVEDMLVDRDDFEAVIRESITDDKVGINLEAFDLGQKFLAS